MVKLHESLPNPPRIFRIRFPATIGKLFKNKSFHKNGTEIYERRWNDRVALDGDYADEYSRFLVEKPCFLCEARDFSVHVLHIDLKKNTFFLFVFAHTRARTAWTINTR